MLVRAFLLILFTIALFFVKVAHAEQAQRRSTSYSEQADCRNGQADKNLGPANAKPLLNAVR